MRVVLDNGICAGSGVCISIAPDLFSWQEDASTAASDAPVPESMRALAQAAMENCPTRAIKVIDVDTD